MTRWRPTPDEERWLAVASRLRLRVDEGELAGRTGGWRVTGPLARVALFALGVVAAGLAWELLDGRAGLGLLGAGVVVLAAGEWLVRARRMHASGVEEALVIAGVTMTVMGAIDFADAAAAAWARPLLAVACVIAGLRLLNPLATTVGAFVLVGWLAREPIGLRVDAWLGPGTFAVLAACVVAGAALAAGSREYRRPSHDRMLDGLVAALPVAAYGYGGGWAVALRPELLGITGGSATSAVVPAVLAAYATIALVTGMARKALELYRYASLPAQAWLIVCGALALAAGLVLDRRLRVPRDGITSTRLTIREGPLDLLQLAGASLLAQRDVPATPSDRGFAPGDGRFGGGGAGGSW